MTTPETPSNPQPSSEAETQIPVVTFIPDFRMVQISGLSEEPGYMEHTWSHKDTAQKVRDRLSAAYIALGQGVFSLDEVREASHLSATVLPKFGMEADKVFPDEIFSYRTVAQHGVSSMEFGNFAIVSRITTEEERQAWADEVERKKAEAFERQKAEVEAADAEKTDMTDADHALITANGVRFYMPINTTDALIAIRTLQAVHDLRQVGEGPGIRLSTLNKAIWQSMPLVERRLFTDSEKRLYGTAGEAIADFAEKSLTQVANPMHIARRGAVGDYFEAAQQVNVAIEIMDEPPLEPYDRSQITPIFPPGTEKSSVQQNSLGEITEEELADIRDVLDRTANLSGLDHRQALDIVELLANRRSKILTRRVLTERHGAAAAARMLVELDDLAQAALGYTGYSAAQEQRTMHIQGAKGGRAQLVSRRLPGRTFKYLTDGDAMQVTQKWYFGIQRRGF